ncbi:MAG TPA: hypothetical protein VFV87_06910, partial [Pirellulaceae bacterium]|nr:hypothetical protein [Pirellulaceae bacterium]
AGCSTRPAITPVKKTEAEQLANRDDLSLALDSLRKLAEGPDPQAEQRTIFYLNQWLASTKPSAGEWKPDRLLTNLPRSLNYTLGMDRLSDLHFSYTIKLPSALVIAMGGDPENYEVPEIPGTDLPHLQTSLWMHDIAHRAKQTTIPDELAQWLTAHEKQIGIAEAEQLASAERVFDWTIRNIQLDELPPPPKGPAATADARTEPVAPALLGEPGPGYRQLPRDVLVHGHGDAWERARVFILLCRQLQIDTVMLGLIQDQSPVPRGWLPAVLIKDELYLFDTSLGLPIPGPEGKGIATLSQVLADPRLLRKLDVEGEPPYPVTEKDLKIAALIEAEPDALSHRMQLLQGALPADQHLILTARPSLLEPKLRKCRGIGQISLWQVPFEAAMYAFPLGRARGAAQDPLAAAQLQLELETFNPNLPLAKGRNLHLQGRFEKQDQALGARNHYLASRPPDQEMQRVESSEIVRKAMGFQQSLPAGEKEQKKEIEFRMTLARTRKHHATYWMGLTYQEAGNQSAAIEWLADRTMEAYPPSPWIPGARYNLARCYEDLGQWEAARKWLLSDQDSPQRHGNLLRARWIAQRHPQSADPEPSATAPASVEAVPPGDPDADK